MLRQSWYHSRFSNSSISHGQLHPPIFPLPDPSPGPTNSDSKPLLRSKTPQSRRHQ
ncbi:hypothetical protein EX30DRAFT_90398 [Ascodesmis nigricans]|uniref:Uncharacterized protein n=1 Tax=Ascodesmis nigricans TaxID=341454 RepID=A0A4S2N3H5_9PEZI|nr:hypothetical protein EX30DRAFT_90398 [Ascodesmis nigricans]